MTSYSDFVRTLCKPGEAILADLTPASAHLLHMMIGLAGELAELVAPAANLIEELGDAIFFIEGSKQAYTDMTGQPFPPYVSGLEGNQHATQLIDMLLDAGKRIAIYAKHSPEEFTKAVIAIKEAEYAVLELAEYNSISYTEIEQHNREKLKERYKQLTYSNEAAIARADKNA